jgi:uncharacterized protein YvpB
MSLFMQEFQNPTEEVFFKLSAGILRFEYWAVVLVVLLILTILINFILFRIKKIEKVEKFSAKPLNTKEPTAFSKFLKTVFLPAFGFVARGTLYFWNVLLICTIVGSIYYFFFVPPWIVKSTPKVDGYWTDFRKPLEVEFNNPVDTGKLKMHMSPSIPGKWKQEKIVSFLPLVRKVSFIPDESLFSDQHVVIYFTGISHLTNRGKGYETDFEFDIPQLPEVKAIVPAKDTQKVQVEDNVVLELDKFGKENAKWELEITPPVTYTVLKDKEKDVSFKFDEPLQQSTTYTVVVFKTPIRYDIQNTKVVEEGEREQVADTVFTTVKTPGVSSYEPKGKGIFVEDQTIKVVFDQEMVPAEVEKSFTISPEVKGTITWVDEKTFSFKPEGKLTKATHYDLIFAKGMKSKFEGKTENEIKVGFDTIGPVEVAGTTPSNGRTGISTTSNIQVTFNQEVDHASAQSKFSVAPAEAGTFSWSGNTMIFNPSGSFAYQAKHTVTINSGVKTVRGLDSTKAYSFVFTTVPEKFLLGGMPWYKQQEGFTCNIAATRIALAYRGVYLSEGTIKSGVGIQPSKSAGGNPYKGWVSGYGVYWGPVSSFVSNYRSNTIKTGWNLSGLAHEVQSGNPVIIWWHNQWSSAYWMEWTATDGTNIRGLNGMHSEVVYGFKGSPDNPTHIYTKDPWRGNRVYSAGSFNSVWGYFGRTGVVVR